MFKNLNGKLLLFKFSQDEVFSNLQTPFGSLTHGGHLITKKYSTMCTERSNQTPEGQIHIPSTDKESKVALSLERNPEEQMLIRPQFGFYH